MNDYKKLIKRLRYGDYMMNSDPFTLNTKMIEWSAKAADAIEQLVKERDAAIADLEKCMHYTEPKNNNVCNFCKKDMPERQNKCVGWSDFCECEPEWRGVQEVKDGNS